METKRKEVGLTQEVIDSLQKQADHHGRTLKRHMEIVLSNSSKKKLAKFQ